MQEIEMKILDIDAAAIEAQLKEMNAKLDFDGKLVDHIFVKEGFPGLFRIREQGDKIITALKTKIETKGKAKSYDERENEIESVEEGKKQAAALGFEHKTTREKHRKSYSIGNTQFELDKYPNIPAFLEIESEHEDYIVAWAKKLGFEESQLKPWGYSRLAKHYDIK